MAQQSELLQTLEQIGLKEKEAEVYLALLSLESSTAYRIAEHCAVKKPTVYVILEDLRKKGLVLKVPHAKKALFAARDIGEYLEEQKRKIFSVETLMPAFLALAGQGKPNVYFFTGLKGIAESLEHKFDSMRGKTFFSFYSNLATGSSEIKKMYTAWDIKARAAGISFDVIMAKKDAEKYYKDVIESAKEDPEHVRIKYLTNDTYPSIISIEIAADFVRIINEKDLQATIIDDKATAEAMRHIFKIVWEKGE